MKQALGLVEVNGLPIAFITADTMVKAANVKILELENTKGLGLLTIKVAGDVGAVTAAVQAGRQTAANWGKLVSWQVIARPSEGAALMCCRPSSEPAETNAKVMPEPLIESAVEDEAAVRDQEVTETAAVEIKPADTKKNSSKKLKK